MPGPELGHWYILRTRARQEKVLAADLAARSIAFFLPTVHSIRHHGSRRAEVELPLFPGYVFLRGCKEDAYVADRTRRIAQILEVADQETLEGELQSLFLALSHEAPLNPYPYLTRGVRVEVRSGPFRGMQGLVESRLRSHLLILQIDMLGRAVSLEIDASLLDVIDEPHWNLLRESPRRNAGFTKLVPASPQHR